MSYSTLRMNGREYVLVPKSEFRRMTAEDRRDGGPPSAPGQVPRRQDQHRIARGGQTPPGAAFVTYRIEYATAAVRQIERLPRGVQVRIVARIEALAHAPRPVGSIKLAGGNAYRIRVGDYRVIYAVADELLVVLIVKVGHRREVYR